MANIRIISNGQDDGTKIINLETGEEIPGNIVGVDWSASFDDDTTTFYATVMFRNPEVDIEVSENDLAQVHIAPLPSLGDG